MRRVAHSTGLNHDSGGDAGSIALDTVTGLVDALNGKQAKLQVNGVDIAPTVLSTFTLTSGGDGVSHANSLVTAKALEDFIENVLQPSMLTVSPGQSSGVRVGTIPNSSPSNVNVPSVKAVYDFLVNNYMTISEIALNVATINHNHDQTYLPIPHANFSWPAGVTDVELGHLNNTNSNVQQQINDINSDLINHYMTISEIASSYAAFNHNHDLTYAPINGSSNLQFNVQEISFYSSGNSVLTLSSEGRNSGVVTFFGMSVRDGSGVGFLPLFCRDVQYGINGDISVADKISTLESDKQDTIDNNNLLDASLVGDGSISNADFALLGSIDNTIGGQSGVLNLVTSGAVHAGLANLSAQLTTSYMPLVSGGTNGDVLTTDGFGNLSFSTPPAGGNVDAAITSGSTNAVQSNAIWDVFNDYEEGRSVNKNFCDRTDQYLSKALIQIWYHDNNNSWSTNALSESTLDGLISALGLNLTLFKTYYGWPGAGTSGNYYSSSVPPVINIGTGDLKVDSLTFSNHFLVRWTYSTYVYHAGTYNFKLTVDDGGALIIRDTSPNGSSAYTTVIDQQSYSATAATGSITLKRNRLYEIQVAWFVSAGGQSCKLEWQRPIDSVYTAFAPMTPSPDFQYFQPSYTCVRSSVGIYEITFGPTCRPQANTYTIQLTLEVSQLTTASSVDDDFIVSYFDKTPTSFKVIVTEQDNGSGAGTRKDCRFDFLCLSRGRIFCHGSVSGAGVADEETNYG
jgi:hypothetical protein